MKIRNKGSKIINIGTTILMPDASMDINEATLKLPAIQAFIAKGLLETDESDAAIVSTIIGLARQLGLSVVAEGVEDEGSRDRLVDLGCDVAQGYLFSRPLPPDRLAAWFSARDGGRSRVRLLRGSALS